MNRLLRQLRVLPLILLSVITFAGGCKASRVELVPPGEVLKAGPDLKGKVYRKQADGWHLSDRPVAVPEGWYLVPPEAVQP